MGAARADADADDGVAVIRAAVFALIVVAPAVAHAWPMWQPSLPDQPAAPEPEPEPAPVEPAKLDVPTPDELAERIEDLETKTKALEKDQHSNESTRDQVTTLMPLSRSIVIAAFIDIGAFAVAGNGSGIRSDFLHQHYPGYSNTVSGQWVFMGDPFTTMINSLGDPADTADSREVENDAINSSGRPSVIVNSIGLTVSRTVTDEIQLEALAQLLPRPGNDVLEVAYARIEYKPSQKRDLRFHAGKIDPVLGVEYRDQEAPARIGVTPSLICRYTCGRPIGVDARYVDIERGVQLSAAVINGDNFEERFSPDDELRANKLPSAAGHAEYRLPFKNGLWVGASGAIGPQDGQPSLDVLQWHYGLDLNLAEYRGFRVTAEFVQGKQRGSTSGNLAADQMTGLDRAGCDVAECLKYKGAYVLVSQRLKRWTPYARFDWRDATHQRSADFVYEARSVRGTVGLHVKVNDHVLAKVEYNWNHELGVPSFPHDVITGSIVVKTN